MRKFSNPMKKYPQSSVIIRHHPLDDLGYFKGCSIMFHQPILDVGQNGRPTVGPQMWMSSLVLTIQLLGYLILIHTHLAVCQNLVPLVNIKIAGKWMFIPLKIVLIGINPYPFWVENRIKPIPPARPRRRSAPAAPAACGPKVALRCFGPLFWEQKTWHLVNKNRDFNNKTLLFNHHNKCNFTNQNFGI